MDTQFWLQRWTEGQIGFHQEQVNPYLVQNWKKLGAKKGDAVFVPLCGKSKDMLWLHRQGLRVIGVELSPLAIQSFVDENQIAATQSQQGAFVRTHADGYDLLCGDFFNLEESHLSGVTSVYDRASLIALPPEMRKQYADKLRRLLKTGNEVLLITMDYPQQEMNGPPFSVSEHEVRELYHRFFEIEKVGEIDVMAANPHFRQRGLTQMMEVSYLMKRK